MLKSIYYILLTLIIVAISIPLHQGYAGNEVYERVEKPVIQAIDIHQETQKAQTIWQEQREKLSHEYEQLQKEREKLKSYKENLKQTVSETRGRFAEKEKQLADIEQISVQIKPFLKEVIMRLHQQVDNDIPFLSEERRIRLDKLDHLMPEPDVSISEKFRKIIEAVMVEADYGRTIEVYQETINVNGSTMLVNIFRLGRIALFYQTLDGKDCGFYNVALNSWKPIPKSYNYTIQNAVDVGAKRRPVELLSLPIGRINIK